MRPDLKVASGVEWGTPPGEDKPDWPILHPAEDCDGLNPMTGRVCIRGYHDGYHRDDTGAEWLDD